VDKTFAERDDWVVGLVDVRTVSRFLAVKLQSLNQQPVVYPPG
jgi:hypothetical protein